MVLSFFRAGDSGLDHVVTRSVAMVNDARHSFDLACTVFFFNDAATTEIYTLSLHDALPIYGIIFALIIGLLSSYWFEDFLLGIAPHSLRTVSPVSLKKITEIRSGGPIHIHIAEQIKEVELIKSNLGARPVEWLLNNVDVDSRWCTIHATHMTKKETKKLAKSGAVVGLCPITEANLGDGIFDGKELLLSGGKYGIGSDSNIRISLTDVLITLPLFVDIKI